MTMKTNANRAFPKRFQETRDALFGNDEPLFTVVGDLGMDRRYGDAAICFFRDRMTVFGCHLPETAGGFFEGSVHGGAAFTRNGFPGGRGSI